jgi:hypothetical protein
MDGNQGNVMRGDHGKLTRQHNKMMRVKNLIYARQSRLHHAPNHSNMKSSHHASLQRNNYANMKRSNHASMMRGKYEKQPSC